MIFGVTFLSVVVSKRVVATHIDILYENVYLSIYRTSIGEMTAT